MKGISYRNKNEGKKDANGRPKKANWSFRFEMASVNGVRKFKEKSGFATKKEAIEAGTAAYDEYNTSGSVFEATDMSYSDVLDSWLENYVKINCNQNTQAQYKDRVDRYVRPQLGGYAVVALRRETIQLHMNSLFEQKHATSTYTAALQQLLGGVDVDGVFGSQTKKAVAAYQTAKGLDADGIAGPKTWSALVTGESEPVPESVPINVVFVQPVDYKQGDSRWGSKMYSNHNDKSQTMKNSACGPTSMADIVATWVDKNLTPYDLAQLALSWGDRTYSSGTAWAFFRHVQEHYKFRTMIQTTNLATLKACLEGGGYAVASMGPGYWTKGGHYICLWKHDGTNIFANDPASSSRKKQKLTQFIKERKQYFCFYK